MQLISLGSQYVISALIILGRSPHGTAISAAELSRSLKSPSTYLSQLLAKLIEPGILGSKRGYNGGVYLIKKADKIRMMDIVIAIDGDHFFTTCLLGIKGCGHIEPCPFHDEWGQKKDKIRCWLEETTLQSLCESVSDDWVNDRMIFNR